MLTLKPSTLERTFNCWYRSSLLVRFRFRLALLELWRKCWLRREIASRPATYSPNWMLLTPEPKSSRPKDSWSQAQTELKRATAAIAVAEADVQAKVSEIAEADAACSRATTAVTFRKKEIGHYNKFDRR